MLDAAFWMIVAGLVGSRVVYGIVNAGEFARVCFHGGGAPRSAGARAVRLRAHLRDLAGRPGVLRRHRGRGAGRLPLRAARGLVVPRCSAILFAPALALGHAFGRLGCFAAGCCFGKAGGGSWAVAFPRGVGRVRRARRAWARSRPAGRRTPGPAPDAALRGGRRAVDLHRPARAAPARPQAARAPCWSPTSAATPCSASSSRSSAATSSAAWSSRSTRPASPAGCTCPPHEPIFLSVGQLGSLIVLALCAVVWAPAAPE